MQDVARCVGLPKEAIVSDEVELIADGNGVAVIGEKTAVEQFLAGAGMEAKELDLSMLRTGMSRGAALTQAGAEVTANFGRWLKLTEESAEALKKGTTLKGSSKTTFRGTLIEDGKFTQHLQFLRTPGAALTNPALLSGVAGLMAQQAMEHAMEEITDYLRTIDSKVDDVLRAQKDAVYADMIGVGLVLDDACVTRQEVGRVSEVTWSRIQGSHQIIAKTQAYALRQIQWLSEKIEKENRVDELAELVRDTEKSVVEWLAVLARSFQLQDVLGVLELDRVLDASPEELDAHRRSLVRAREKRRTEIAQTTANLIERINAAAAIGKAGVLFNPVNGKRIVEAGNETLHDISAFEQSIGIESSATEIEGRGWKEAIGDLKDDIVDKGSDGLDAVKNASGAARDRARDVSTGAMERAKSVGSGAGDRARDSASRLRSGMPKGVNRFRRRKDDGTGEGKEVPETRV